MIFAAVAGGADETEQEALPATDVATEHQRTRLGYHYLVPVVTPAGTDDDDGDEG